MAVGVLDARALPAGNQEHALVGLEEPHPGLHEGDRPPIIEPHQKLVPARLGRVKHAGNAGAVCTLSRTSSTVP